MNRIVFLAYFVVCLVCFGAPDPVSLEWADNSDNEDGFILERSTDGINFAPIADIAENVETFEDDEIEAGVTYHYRILAFNDVGLSGYSNTAIAVIQEEVLSGWIYWEKGGGGVYLFSEDFGWAWTSDEAMPYVMYFNDDQWKPIEITLDGETP